MDASTNDAGGATIRVFVNGEPRPVPAGSTVAWLVGELGLAPAQVAVERNKVIVRRAEHAATVLADGDRLEVVTFFGGG
ncbi:MAG: sulfur carrier protein ThiS [Planctomycetota bacterium]